MNNKGTNGMLAGTGLLSAVAASLCCIAPVISLVAGSSGVASSVSWLEPARPYLFGFTIAVLGFAWYRKLRPGDRKDACGCPADGKPKFMESKKFLGVITLFSVLMLSFPYYSNVFFHGPGSCCAEEVEAVTLNNEQVSFFKVPLVCNAAPSIGCGSRAKPALLELERDPNVKEAWLSRAGTVIAVVWKASAENEVAAMIMKKNNIDFTSPGGNEIKMITGSFRRENEWYRGSDVDKLSLEEAGTIANRYVSLALEKKWISVEDADKIKPDVENYFRAELVKLRTVEELYNDAGNKFRQSVIDIFTRHIGAEKTGRVVEMYNAWVKECEEEEGACNMKEDESCCKKSK